MTTERRKNPRVQILGKLHGHIVALDVPVTVSEISLGGMRIETDIAFPIGSMHAFQLTLGDGSVVRVTGRAVHCRRVAHDNADRYETGIQFADEAPEVVADLMDHLS